MSDWETVKLNDLARIERGRFSPRPRNDPQYYGGDVPFVQTGDVSRAGIYIQEYSQTLNQKGLAVSKLFPKRTILMTIAANIGDVAILGFDSACPDSVVAFIPKEGVDNEWLFHTLKNMRYHFESLATQNAQKNLSLEKIKPVKVLVPPLIEQKKIASVLQKWDEAIEKTERLIAAKQKQFEWLTSKLFKKNVFTEFKLGDISKISSGGTPKSSIREYYGGDIPWVSIADMTAKGMWIQKTKRNITKIGLENSSAKVFPKYSVLYAMYASIGECSIAGAELSSSQAILGIRPIKDKLDYEYLYYYLSSLKEKIKLQGQWGTQSNLNAEMVKKFKIPTPPLPEQKSIAHTLNTAQQEIKLLQQLAQNYRTQKRGLMQKLLTGEWRLGTDKQEEAA